MSLRPRTATTRMSCKAACLACWVSPPGVVGGIPVFGICVCVGKGAEQPGFLLRAFPVGGVAVCSWWPCDRAFWVFVLAQLQQCCWGVGASGSCVHFVLGCAQLHLRRSMDGYGTNCAAQRYTDATLPLVCGCVQAQLACTGT